MTERNSKENEAQYSLQIAHNKLIRIIANTDNEELQNAFLDYETLTGKVLADGIIKKFFELSEENPMTKKSAEEIAREIFYSPATNGKAEESIANGARLIEEYSRQSLPEPPSDESQQEIEKKLFFRLNEFLNDMEIKDDKVSQDNVSTLAKRLVQDYNIEEKF